MSRLPRPRGPPGLRDAARVGTVAVAKNAEGLSLRIPYEYGSP